MGYTLIIPRAVHPCAQAERSAAHTETAAHCGSRGSGAKAAIVTIALYLYADADRRLISTARFMYMDVAGGGNDPPEAERLLRISYARREPSRNAKQPATAARYGSRERSL
jgi:hypothetical protein